MSALPVTDLRTNVLTLAVARPLLPVVTVRFTRYAVEDDVERITLDTAIGSNTGKVFPANILEQKSTQSPALPMPALLRLGYPPVKLSKFLWATSYGVR